MNSRAFDDRDLPSIFVSPEDAGSHRLRDGEPAVIRSAHGQLTGAVRIDRGLRAGVVQIPHGWSGGDNVNLLTSADDLDPISGMPRFSGIPVEIEPLQ